MRHAAWCAGRIALAALIGLLAVPLALWRLALTGQAVALDRLRAGRPTPVIAQRLSTVRDADQIVVLMRAVWLNPACTPNSGPWMVCTRT